MKSFLLIGLGFVGGIFISTPFFKSGHEPAVIHDVDSTSQELQLETPVCQVPNDENSANAMLSQLLKLFLVDVAMRLSQDNQNLLAKNINQTCPTTSNEQSSNSPHSQTSRHSVRGSKNEGQDSAEIDRLRRMGQRGADVDQRDFDSAADRLRVDNFFPILKETQKPSVVFFQQLEGEYSGIFKPIDKNNDAWESRLSIKITKISQKIEELEVQYDLFWKRNGGESNTSGDGKVETIFSQIKGIPRSLVIPVKGGDWYLNLFLSVDGRTLLGNVYQKKTIDNFAPIASVFLERTR